MAFAQSNKNDMKKLFILILSGLILSFGGCKKHDVIEKNDSSLSECMHNYFDADYVDEVKGEYFQAKLLSLAKIYYNETIIYKYSFVIAPRLDEKMDIYNFTLSLNDEAKNYYLQYGYTKYDLYMTKFFSKGEIPVKYNKEDLIAYRWEIQIDNITNEYQKECDISDEQFDQMISELYITVNFNHRKETIKLETDDFLIIKNEQDIPEGRVDLLSYLQNGYFIEPFFGPFDNKYWKY